MLEILLENDFISSILAFGLILIPAIIIHEFGHFIGARMIGVNVLEFGVGFPPRMFKLFTWGETEFTMNWIPLGGFVRPLGEDMIGPVIEEDELEKSKNDPYYVSERQELRNRGVRDEDMLSVFEAKPWGRIWFMFAGPLANFVSAIFFFMIVALLGLPVVIGARVQINDIDTTLSIASQLNNENDVIERIDGALFQDTQEFIELWIAANGQEVTLQLLDVETTETYEITTTPTANDVSIAIMVVGISEGSPAEQAGLELEDLITHVNGEPFDFDTDPIATLIDIGVNFGGQEVLLTVQRNSNTFDLTLVPNAETLPRGGRIGINIATQYLLDDGLQFASSAPQQELIPQSIGDSVVYGFTRFFEVLELIVSIPSQIISGAISPEEARPVSVVGISQVGGQFLQQSIREGTPGLIFDFIALISIFLGATNLLPFPPLDGGRILFVLIEIFRGKPLPIQFENAVYRIGIFLLLSLGVLIIIYDIANPFVLPQ